jgi:hypothetical protein
VRVSKDASVAEIAAAAAVVPVSAALSASVLLFPEIPGLMRPSSYALDPSAPSSLPLLAVVPSGHARARHDDDDNYNDVNNF